MSISRTQISSKPRNRWLTWLAHAGVALGLMSAVLLAAPAHADVQVVEYAQGWINSAGGNNRPGPDSNNYTGNESGLRFNSWVAFYIPPGKYTSATLSLDPSTYGAAGPSLIGMYQVETRFDVLMDDYVPPGVDAYKDLGSGRQYASATLFNDPLSLNLNGRGLADINAAAGTYFFIGFTNHTLNALPQHGEAAGIYISGFGREQVMMTLDLGQAAPVPEPSTWALLLGGVSLLAVRGRRLHRRGLKAAGAAAAVAAIGMAPAAQADTIDFEGLNDIAFVMDGDSFQHGGYQFGGQFIGAPEDSGGLVGAIMDGGDAGLCEAGGLECPRNNASHYYGALNDGVLHMSSTQAGQTFRLSSFDAAFIGSWQGVHPEISGLLLVRGERADHTVFDEIYALADPNLGFGHYQTSAAFSTTDFVQLSFTPYACNWYEQCHAFDSNMGQMGLDNLNVSAVPEPSTYMMLGMGLLGLAAVRRQSSKPQQDC
ncbi:NF038120 family PEP-CTERM protein [Duganella sp. PWIR1]